MRFVNQVIRLLAFGWCCLMVAVFVLGTLYKADAEFSRSASLIRLLIVSAWGLFALFHVKRVLFKARSGLSQTKELLTLLLFSVGVNIFVPISMAIVLAIADLIATDIDVDGESNLGGILVTLAVCLLLGYLFLRRKKKLSAKPPLKKQTLDSRRPEFTFHELTDDEEPKIGTWYRRERWTQGAGYRFCSPSTPSDWEKICESYVAGLSYEDRFKSLIKTCGHPEWTLKVWHELDNEYDDQARAIFSSYPSEMDLKIGYIPKEVTEVLKESDEIGVVPRYLRIVDDDIERSFLEVDLYFISSRHGK